MKNLSSIATKTVSLFALFFMIISLGATAQSPAKTIVMKDCVMMKDGKMMVMKEGKIMPMNKDMVMKNGTKCMTNGECITKDGKKMMMKNGDCMEMSGKMCTDKMKKMALMTYECPMHGDVTADKPSKCPKCGMNLVKKA